MSPAMFEEKTGFSVLKQMLLEYCKGAGGKQLAEAIAFSRDAAFVENELQLTDEFRTLLLTQFGYPASEYFNLDTELEQITVPGSFMPAETVLLLYISYETYCNCLSFINAVPSGAFEQLKYLISGYSIEASILTHINRVMDKEGNIRDNASAALLQIRRELENLSRQIDKRIAQALNHAKQNKLVPPETEIVLREGIPVIPVASANKRKLGGVIMDESASGQTSYIEPIEVFELRNSIRELELAEKREIIKILIELADEIRPFIPVIIQSLHFLARLDMLYAKARLAIELNALKPQFTATPQINWLQARHPLLILSLRKQNRQVVASDISLDSENRILIISGPNAGGKSVCLKTVGLCQYMLQCGLLIPVLDTSIAGMFDDIFIDIGDQQSIENDLSTYSSHLLNIRNLIAKANDKTLFLIDEFGAGTEPQSGGAIAEAVLETLNKKGAYGVVTTHYANLKLLASNYKGFVNGAMLYDTKGMKPLYVLRTGKPGSSFAFEIARNIQFPEEVLKLAGEKVGNAKLDFDKQMQDLEAERLELATKEKQLLKADQALSEILQKYTALKTDLETRKKEIIETAHSEAKRIVSNSNKLIENTIREIKESKAEAEKTKQLRETVKAYAEEIEKVTTAIEKEPEPMPEIAEPAAEVINGAIEKGSRVRMKGLQEIGTVTDITGSDATVAFNTVTMKLALHTLERVKENHKNRKQVNRGIGYQNMVNDMNSRMANFRLTIDVRGKRAEETQAIIQKYIDEAVMLHVPEVNILHGKGNGILRSIIRQYLQSLSEVKHVSDAPLEQGGAGITVVRLK